MRINTFNFGRTNAKIGIEKEMIKQATEILGITVTKN